MASPDRPSEFALIERYFSPLSAGKPLAFGLTDDAAVVRPLAGRDLVVTKDVLVSGEHFLPGDPPDLIARKLLRVNLSDLAAMGAQPVGYLLGLVLPHDFSAAWLEAFCAGLAGDQKRFGIGLLGGDTVATSGPLCLSLTALGEVPEGKALRRSGARSGDLICVSGTIGDGAFGLEVLLGKITEDSLEDTDFLIRRYRIPQPRLGLGRRLVGLASAVIDVSDGLIADLGHIADCSGVGARVVAEQIPLSPVARRLLDRNPESLATILGGGDDYELLFTVDPDALAEVTGQAKASHVTIQVIGMVLANEGIRVIDGEGQEIPLQSTGYRHF